MTFPKLSGFIYFSKTFLGLEIAVLKFHDFSRFFMTVQTLYWSLHQATVISMSPIRLVVVVLQQYIVTFSMLHRKQDTGLTHSKYFCLMLHCQICHTQSDDVTDHYLVSCMLPITDINYMALRYCPGRTIVPATKDRFTNNLPDLSQLLCVPINTHELDKMTSNMGTIFSNTLEAVAPIKLKKVREKCTAQWYNGNTHSLKKKNS